MFLSTFLIVLLLSVISSGFQETGQQFCDSESCDHSFKYSRLRDFVSSVTCSIYKDKSHYCRVENLCVKTATKELLFFLDSERSKFIPEYLRSSYETFDFGRFSPVSSHNRYKIPHLISVPINRKYKNGTRSLPSKLYTSISEKATFIRGNTILMSSFKPDNLMHLIHDDLLPLYATMKYLGLDRRMTGVWNFGPELQRTILFRSLFNSANIDVGEFVCFEKAFLGLISTTQWYDYGFLQPQAPIPLTPSEKAFIHTSILEFKTNVLEAFGVDRTASRCESLSSRKETSLIALVHKSSSSKKNTTVPQTIIFSRTVNRKILNPRMLSRQFPYTEVVPISPELVFNFTNMKEILSKIVCTKLLVGIHGAELVFSMFLPDDSLLFELFPFGVEPKSVQTFSSLVKITETAYESWMNPNSDMTVFNLEAPFLKPFNQDYKRNLLVEIISEEKFEMKLCCDHPEWLFRIYQDTKIHFEDMRESLNNIRRFFEMDSKDKSSTFLDPIYHLSEPTDISCTFEDSTIKIRWFSPWNIPETIQPQDLIKEYHVSLKNNGKIQVYKRTESPLIIPNLNILNLDIFSINDEEMEDVSGIMVWILPIINDNYRRQYFAHRSREPTFCSLITKPIEKLFYFI